MTHLLERFSVALIDAEETGEGLCFRCSAYFDDNCPVTTSTTIVRIRRCDSRARESVMAKEA